MLIPPAASQLTPPTPAAAAAGLTAVDFTTADAEANTGGLDAGASSFGESSTLVAAAVHGRLDVGLDAYLRMVDIGAPPASAVGVRVRMVCTTPPGSNSTGGTAGLILSVSNTTTLSSAEGVWMRQGITTGGALKASAVTRWGTGVTDGATVVGAITSDLIIPFKDGKLSHANNKTAGSTSGDNISQSTDTVTSTHTNLYVGIGLDMTNASPSAGITWADVAVSYEWLDS